MVPEVKAINRTVPDLDRALSFYAGLFPEARLSEGVFAGISYKALLGGDDEVMVCLFQAGEANPLAASFPTVMVESVSAYLSQLDTAGAKVVVPESACPCTSAPFAIFEDETGGQLMVKQFRR